ncbi:unnamed protein product [Urochloa humidicola]
MMRQERELAGEQVEGCATAGRRLGPGDRASPAPVWQSRRAPATRRSGHRWVQLLRCGQLASHGGVWTGDGWGTGVLNTSLGQIASKELKRTGSTCSGRSVAQGQLPANDMLGTLSLMRYRSSNRQMKVEYAVDWPACCS